MTLYVFSEKAGLVHSFDPLKGKNEDWGSLYIEAGTNYAFDDLDPISTWYSYKHGWTAVPIGIPESVQMMALLLT